MSDNEKLIEEAAKANKNDLLDFLSKGEAWQAIRGMDAPGLATELDAAGFRRSEAPEPTCEHGTSLTDLCEHVERLVNAPQGEPSDALTHEPTPEAIEAARLAYQGAYEADYDAEDCIAFALRAAGEAQ